MPFFNIPFPVPHSPLLEIYFCALGKLLDISACLIQMATFMVCEILHTFQVIDFGGSVLQVQVCRDREPVGKINDRR